MSNSPCPAAGPCCGSGASTAGRAAAAGCGTPGSRGCTPPTPPPWRPLPASSTSCTPTASPPTPRTPRCPGHTVPRGRAAHPARCSSSLASMSMSGGRCNLNPTLQQTHVLGAMVWAGRRRRCSTAQGLVDVLHIAMYFGAPRLVALAEAALVALLRAEPSAEFGERVHGSATWHMRAGLVAAVCSVVVDSATVPSIAMECDDVLLSPFPCGTLWSGCVQTRRRLRRHCWPWRMTTASRHWLLPPQTSACTLMHRQAACLDIHVVFPLTYASAQHCCCSTGLGRVHSLCMAKGLSQAAFAAAGVPHAGVCITIETADRSDHCRGVRSTRSVSTGSAGELTRAHSACCCTSWSAALRYSN